ncbi:MAG: hypothetical protein R3B90_20245 [Planctomycetaceae bacterium]
MGAAIALLGGAFYAWAALLPAARDLPAAEHDALRERIKARWKKVVMLGILLLLVTGFYNYLMVAAQVQGQKLYHPLMGVKILIAFVIFFLASVLTGRSPAFEGMRQNMARSLMILLILGGIVVSIASVLKVVVPRSRAAVVADE